MGTRILSIILCLALFLPAGSAAEPPNATLSSDAAPAAVSVEVTERSPEAAEPSISLTPEAGELAAQPLSAEEEASLMARAEEPDPEVAGGALSNQQLTYAVIALGAIALVLVLK